MHRAVANFRKNIWFPETLWNMSNLCWKKHKRLLLQSSLHYVLYRILYYFRLGSPVSYEILQYCTLYSVHSDPACPQKVISVERIRIRFPVWCRFKHACRILLLIDAIHMLLVAMLDYPWRMDDTVFERFLSSLLRADTTNDDRKILPNLIWYKPAVLLYILLNRLCILESTVWCTITLPL